EHPLLRPVLPRGAGGGRGRRVLADLLPARHPLALRPRLLHRAVRAGARDRRRAALADAVLRPRDRRALAGHGAARTVERLDVLPPRGPRGAAGGLPALLRERPGADLPAAGGHRALPAAAGEAHPAPAALGVRARRLVLPGRGGDAGLHAPAPPGRGMG